MFDSSVSTAESWRVKLADFGNAILFTNQAMSNERALNYIPGTPFYRPPEADNPSLHVTVRTVTAIDIWGWGLLLWQVIIGGGNYVDEEGREINEEIMDTIRDQDSVAHVAWRSCSKFMRLNHFDEQPRFRAGLQSALLQSLSVEPSQRPTAVDLLDRLQNLLSEQ